MSTTVYSESAQKTLPENAHFLTLGRFMEILRKKLGGAAFGLFRKKKLSHFIFISFLEIN
jgi:hypothetical protein